MSAPATASIMSAPAAPKRRMLAIGSDGGIEPSAEQIALMTAFADNKHVVSEAVPGAGKSTSLLMCAELEPKKVCLQLTYNKRLQTDVDARIRACGLRNATVRTYHSAASTAYCESGAARIHNDSLLMTAVAQAPEFIEKLRCDTLMLDEVQDMTIGYFIFARYIIRAFNPQIIIVGDRRQAVNKYKEARVEFLVEAPRIFGSINAGKDAREWAACPLTTSRRLTPAIAQFVNNHIVGAPLIVGGNTAAPNLKPTYVAAGFNQIAAAMGKEILRLVAKYGAPNVMLIAPTVRNIGSGSNPLAVLIKEHLAGVKVFIAEDLYQVNDDRLLAGKLVVTTWASTKGREADAILLCGFEEAYFRYYEKEWTDPHNLPEVMFVAATRARRELVIVAANKGTLRTFDMTRLRMDTTVLGAPARPICAKPKAEKDRFVGVLDLLRHIDVSTTRAVLSFIEVIETTRVGLPAVQPDLVVGFDNDGGHYENVAMLYGIVVPRLAELRLTGGTKFGEFMAEPFIVATIDDLRKDHPEDITRAAYDSLPEGFWETVSCAFYTEITERTHHDWFLMAVAQHAMWGGYYHVARQIRHYNWVDDAFLTEATACVVKTLSAQGKAAGPSSSSRLSSSSTAGAFEVAMGGCVCPGVYARGFADYVEGDGTIWEFKVASAVCDDHLLQVGTYLALAQLEDASKGVELARVGKVYAIRGGEIQTVRVTDAVGFLRAVAGKFDPKITGDILEDIAAFERLLAEDGEAARAMAGLSLEAAPEEYSDTSDLYA
jgi:hypothetical protein